MQQVESSVVNYWDNQWEKRTFSVDQGCFNKGKWDFLCNQVAVRPYFFTLEKLDIGCGTGTYAYAMGKFNPRFTETYTGIDMSPYGIKICKERGLNCEVADFYEYNPERKFGIFMFMDVLEHMDDNQKIADSILRLAEDNFYVFGNVPLYRSEHEKDGGFERHMDITVIFDLIEKVGSKGVNQHIYGINGYPYMMFETYVKK